MRWLEEHEFDKMYRFWVVTDIAEFCDPDDKEAFRREAYLYADIVHAYDSCPDTAGKAYNEAKAKAVQHAQSAFAIELFDTEDKEAAETEAFTAYCDTMRDLFFYKLIQYRWLQVQEYRKQTSVISQGLYRDYLDALDLQAYVLYRPPVAA